MKRALAGIATAKTTNKVISSRTADLSMTGKLTPTRSRFKRPVVFLY